MMRKDAPEHELLKDAVGGDQYALAELFDVHRPALTRYCRQILRDPALAEDAVQDTYLRVRRAIGSFETERAFWPWLQTIARRLCVDELRRDVRQRAPGTSPHAGWQQDEAAVVVDLTDRRKALRGAFSQMSGRHGRILYLREVEGLSYEELAAAEGSTVSSMAKVLVRAKDSARRLLPESLLGVAALVWLRLRTVLGRVASIEFSAAVQSVAVVGLLIVVGPFSGSPSQSHGDFANNAKHGLLAARVLSDPISSAHGAEPVHVRSRRGQSGPSGPGLVIRTHPKNDQGVDPTGGAAHAELTGPDGGTLWSFDNSHDCGGGGVLTPSASPLQLRC